MKTVEKDIFQTKSSPKYALPAGREPVMKCTVDPDSVCYANGPLIQMAYAKWKQKTLVD
jgi:hypothetical protein